MLSLEDAKKSFYEDIDNNRVSHAYMISSNSDNKDLLNLAQEFSKRLLVTDNLNSSPDYKYIEKKEDKKELVIKQIREELISGLYLTPASSNYKVYVINDAGSMNIESQNALLKSLEEPPRYVVIILIKKISDIMLPTIVSRVKEIVIDVHDEVDILKYVSDKYGVQLDKKMIEYAKCSYERADKLGEEINFEMFKIAERVSNLVGKKNSIDIIIMIDKISLKDGLFLDYLENILYLDGNISKLKYIEKATYRLKQNGNEDMIKTIIAIELAK